MSRRGWNVRCAVVRVVDTRGKAKLSSVFRGQMQLRLAPDRSARAPRACRRPLNDVKLVERDSHAMTTQVWSCIRPTM